MKSSRLFSVLLVLVMVFSIFLAACGPAEPEPTEAPPAPTEEPAGEALPYGLKPGKPYEGQTITLLLNNAAKNTALAERAGKFTEMTGIEVVFDMVPFGSLLEKIMAEGVGGTGNYDIITYLDSWGPSIKQFLVPLDNMIADAGIDLGERYPPAYVQAVTYDGQIYALPWRGHPQLMFYRKDVLEDLGLEVPKTWAEYEEMARVITEKTDLYGAGMYYGKNAGQNMFVWTTMLWANGGDYFDENWKPIFNNAEGVEATQRYVDFLLKDGTAPPGAVMYSEYEGTQSLAQAESASTITWWWQYTRMIDPEVAQPEVVDNVAFAPVPEWEGKGGATYAIVMPLSIFESSKSPEAAWEFLKWATSAEMEKDIVTTKEKPETTTNVAVHIANLVDPEVNAAWGNMHQFAAESLAVSRIMPQLAEWPEIVDVIETALNDIASGEPTQETLDAAAAEVEKIMERAGYY